MNMLSKSLRIAQNAWMTSTAFQGLDRNLVYSLAARPEFNSTWKTSDVSSMQKTNLEKM
jgi:hypothetical protein